MKNFKSVLRYIGKAPKFVDYPLLVTYIVLSLIGLVMVYSVSMVPATKGTLTGGTDVPGMYLYNRQLVYVIMSFITVFFIASLMNVRSLSNIKTQEGMIITIVSPLSLASVIGKDINGSKNWTSLGFMNLQASELLKTAIILYIPFMINKEMPRVLSKPKLILSPIVSALGCTFLVFSQKGAGQILLILIILIAIIFYSGTEVDKVLRPGIPAVPGFLVVFVIALIAGQLPSYLTARFNTLADPPRFESGTGHYISDSLLATGNGGVFRKESGNSVMELGYSPEPHTDSVFAIICGELGLIGGLLVITLEFFIVYHAFQFTNRTSPYFYKLVCVGIATYFGSQTFVNIGGISVTTPLTGVPSPSINFGGPSTISLSIVMGLLLIVGKQIKIDQQRKKQQQKADIRRQFG